MPRANVRSLDSVQRFRPKVSKFEEDLAAALTSLRQEINRTLQWIDHDCPSYWQNQVRMGFDRVAEARTQLTRKSMITVAGHRSECIDEKKALAKAKANLELAQEKVQACRQWSIKAHHAADEYTARVGRVEQHVGKGLPRIKMMLDRMIAALESYASMQHAAISDLEVTVPDDELPAGTAEPAAETAKSTTAADVGAESAAVEVPEGTPETAGTDEEAAANGETGVHGTRVESTNPETAARSRA